MGTYDEDDWDEGPSSLPSKAGWRGGRGGSSIARGISGRDDEWDEGGSRSYGSGGTSRGDNGGSHRGSRDNSGENGGYRGGRGGYRGGRGGDDGGSYHGGRVGGRTSYQRGRGGEDDDDDEGGSYRGGRSGGKASYRGGRGSDEDDEGYRGGRGAGRGSYRGGRGNEEEDGGGNRGYRGGRGGFRGGRGSDEEDGGGYRGHRGGRDGFRGNRGGDDGGERGGRRERGTEDEDGNQEPPRERYIPPEATEDEDVIFGSGISSGINFDKYDNIKVQVSGDKPCKPIQSFEDAGLRPILLENVTKSGYRKPTPIQKNAIPSIMGGRDIMACAQTGSGKTAAFLLPILHGIISEAQESVVTPEGACLPQCVILSPTRELTTQIWQEALKFSRSSILKCCVVYGGTSTYHQTQKIMRGCHVLVATPGRMHDLVNRGRLAFSDVRYVVLDEADRMLDMGFLPEIEKMMNHGTMPAISDRQTLMFSATFPEDIQRLAGKFLRDYLFLTVGIVGGACSDVEQTFYLISKFEKRKTLAEILGKNGAVSERTLVFVETKRNADFLAAFLSESSFPTTSIHGDRLQREREEALADFKSGRMNVLVATAVAARGLDIKGVQHVVNFDLPKSIDEYVHRIGRTGRVGNRGRATSFFDPGQDGELASGLLKILAQAEQEVPDFLKEAASESGLSSYSSGGGFGGHDVRRAGGGRDIHNSGPPASVEQDEFWD